MANSWVAVIEDDEDIRNTLKDVLSEEGYDVHTAENGAQGLNLLGASAGPCVILLDLMMPIMNGWEFIVACRGDQRLSSIPIVVLTAAGNASKPDGASILMRKPLNIDTLLKVVEDYCALAPPDRSAA